MCFKVFPTCELYGTCHEKLTFLTAVDRFFCCNAVVVDIEKSMEVAPSYSTSYVLLTAVALHGFL